MSNIKALIAMKGRLKLHRFVKKSNNYCRYGYENLLWLELLLRLLGLNSLREKVNFLKHLEGEGRLAIFYQRSQVHFIKSVSVPSLATFSQYKRHFNTNQCTYDDLFKLLSQEVQQALFLKETMAHVAVEAKSILNTGLSRHTHVQNIHATLGQQLLLHDTTDNESRWVKHHFYEFLAQLKSLPLLKDKQILLTGDGLYNNQNTRKHLRDKGFYYLLPVKSPPKRLRRLLSHKKPIRTEEKTEKVKQQVIHRKSTLYKIKANGEGITYSLVIEKTLHSLRNNTQKKQIQTLITNCPDETLDYALIKQHHWQVETFHKMKDVWFKEDRYHKSKQNASSYSFINNVLAFITQILDIKHQNELKILSFELYQWLVHWLKKIYQTVLNKTRALDALVY